MLRSLQRYLSVLLFAVRVSAPYRHTSQLHFETFVKVDHVTKILPRALNRAEAISSSPTAMANPTSAPTTHEYTTPLVPSSTATLTIAARHTCSAPASLVFRTLRNTETWRDWNRFCPRVTIRSQPDESDEREAMEFWTARQGRFGGPDKASDAVQHAHAEGTERRRVSLNLEAANRSGSPAGGKRQSADVRRPSGHVARNLREMGGEPSIRLKDGTRMTFHVRMKLPYKLADYTDSSLVVTEVSRPNDPANDDYTLTTTPTHTDAGMSGIYRISWATESPGSGSGPGAYPKFMLQGQRVHEIRPIVDGTGKESSCEIVTWECQRGLLAKVVKKMYGRYLQERFEEWVKSLGDFCEEFVGKVDRRDFGVAAGA